jgi:hypothetical protein
LRGDKTKIHRYYEGSLGQPFGVNME